MKLRRLPEDFRVEELSALPVSASGSYAAYRLVKTGWTTLDALDRLSRVWKIPRRRITHAGLKDRHACTSQVITIENGPRRSLEDEFLQLEYLGQSAREVRAADIVANRFTIVARSLTEEEALTARDLLRHLRATGWPNYFDDQRFGSYVPGRGFLAEFWVREQYEDALRLLFATPSSGDSSTERRQKAILQQHWGNWLECKALLDRSHRRSIITYLCDHPVNYKGAWARVDADLRGLMLSAWQSHLWNQILAAIIQDQFGPADLDWLSFTPGAAPAPRGLTPLAKDSLRQLSLPLPSARTLELPDAVKESYLTTLERLGWPLTAIKVKFPRDKFFARGARPAWVTADDLAADFATDDLDSARQLVRLTFSLPRGAYATMLIKRLWGDATVGEEGDDSPDVPD